MNTKLKNIIKSSVFKDSIVYGLTNALYTGLPLLLMPFLVAVLRPEDYGTVELFRSLSMVFVPLVGLSTVQSITRYYYDLSESKFSLFTSSIVIFQIINTIIVLILLLLLNLFIESEYIYLSYFALVYYLFNQITEALLSIYRVKRLSKKYMVIRIGSVVLDLMLLSILYVILDEFDWKYRVVPNVLSTAIIGGVSIVLLRKKFNVRWAYDKGLLRESIMYSAPLILHMLSGYILNVGDRFFISHYLGKENLGNYSVAYQIALGVSFFYTSFHLAWTPTFFEWMKQGKFKKIKQVRNIVFIALPVLSFFILITWIIVSRYIENLQKYDVDLSTLTILSIAYVLFSYYRFNSTYYFYYKTTKTLAIISGVTSLVCLVGYFILIPKWGINGAAWTTLFTFVLMFFATSILKDKSVGRTFE